MLCIYKNKGACLAALTISGFAANATTARLPPGWFRRCSKIAVGRATKRNMKNAFFSLVILHHVSYLLLNSSKIAPVNSVFAFHSFYLLNNTPIFAFSDAELLFRTFYFAFLKIFKM